MAYINGLTNHVRDQLAARFSIFEEMDYRDIANKLLGKEGVDWTNPSDVVLPLDQPGYPRRVLYNDMEMVFVCVDTDRGPLAVTVLRNFVVDNFEEAASTHELNDEVIRLRESNERLTKIKLELEDQVIQLDRIKICNIELEKMNYQLADQVEALIPYKEAILHYQAFKNFVN